ncbi:protein shisa-3 homolog isoform X2 [Ascaphus truei]|uniref:protein shisa-3 homolog isoform X2 n=1 Tax=Ascaphus truei TaxID=8439 RepID=UPI003F59D200
MFTGSSGCMGKPSSRHGCKGRRSWYSSMIHLIGPTSFQASQGSPSSMTGRTCKRQKDFMHSRNVHKGSSEEPVYVPFLIVASTFIAFIIVGSLVAVYCCTCLRPKQTSQQPMRFTLRSYPTETLPMILTSSSLRTPSRQSSTATSSTSTGGSVCRLSSSRADPGCLVSSPPPPYSSAHSIHLSPPPAFLVSTQYFSYPLQQEALPNKNCPDFRQS